MKAASDVVKVFTETLLHHKVYLRHGVEAQSVFVTFAASFLIKVSEQKLICINVIDVFNEATPPKIRIFPRKGRAR